MPWQRWRSCASAWAPRTPRPTWSRSTRRSSSRTCCRSARSPPTATPSTCCWRAWTATSAASASARRARARGRRRSGCRRSGAGAASPAPALMR